jgi:hypothetical protein
VRGRPVLHHYCVWYCFRCDIALVDFQASAANGKLGIDRGSVWRVNEDVFWHRRLCYVYHRKLLDMCVAPLRWVLPSSRYHQRDCCPDGIDDDDPATIRGHVALGLIIIGLVTSYCAGLAALIVALKLPAAAHKRWVRVTNIFCFATGTSCCLEMYGVARIGVKACGDTGVFILVGFAVGMSMNSYMSSRVNGFVDGMKFRIGYSAGLAIIRYSSSH